MMTLNAKEAARLVKNKKINNVMIEFNTIAEQIVKLKKQNKFYYDVDTIELENVEKLQAMGVAVSFLKGFVRISWLEDGTPIPTVKEGTQDERKQSTNGKEISFKAK